MRRILSCILVLSMMLSIIVTGMSPVYADEYCRVYMDLSESQSSEEKLVYNISYYGAEGTDITALGLFLDYSDNLSLVSVMKIFTEEGMHVFSETIDIKPYQLLWVSGTAGLPEGETVMLRLTFDVTDSLSSGIWFDLRIDPDNMPMTVV